ncbi:MAG TPA: DUF1080 domain-containing protein [Pirellulaceae bacterium]|nr:DUF1080 domain-containing protein [Pirellulaceae bacterium]HMP68949.1 DUF1080 domain-containing protein [Pirellulaceae bacterium]
MTYRSNLVIVSALAAVSILVGLGASWFANKSMVDEYKSGIVWPEPPIITAQPGLPPSDAIVLFDGTDMSAWHHGDRWRVADGYTEVGNANIVSKQSFGDCQLHLEFATPAEVRGEGQGRGNSGVFLMGIYEVQILDSYDNKTYFDGQCGAVYKQSPPIVNACRPPGEWQSYDIIFKAPKFNEDGSVKSPAYVTVLHNGVVIHNHFELLGGTFFNQPPHYNKHDEKLPIAIQNHGDPVRFRNIWVRENVQAIEGTRPTEKE